MFYSSLKFYSHGPKHTLNPRTSVTANDIFVLLPERESLPKKLINKWVKFFLILTSNYLFYSKGSSLTLNTEQKRMVVGLPTEGTIKEGLTFAIELLKKMPADAVRRYSKTSKVWSIEVTIGNYHIFVKFDSVTAATLGAIKIKQKSKKAGKEKK